MNPGLSILSLGYNEAFPGTCNSTSILLCLLSNWETLGLDVLDNKKCIFFYNIVWPQYK